MRTIQGQACWDCLYISEYGVSEYLHNNPDMSEEFARSIASQLDEQKVHSINMIPDDYGDVRGHFSYWCTLCGNLNATSRAGSVYDAYISFKE